MVDIISKPPAAGFGVNSMQEIKSHSAILTNERMAIYFYMLGMKSINMNMSYSVPDILEFRAILKTIYKDMRMLIRYNPIMRSTLNLDTQDDGTYVTDIALRLIDRMIEHCETNGWSTKKIYIVVEELNQIEMMLKDILQYQHYFYRPDFRSKPDIDLATNKYKEIADTRTVEELRKLVGKNHQIDFEGLGSSRIELDHSKFEAKPEEEEESIDSPTGLKAYKEDTEFEEYEDDTDNS